MIKVIFIKDSGKEYVVEYTDKEVEKYGRDAIVNISDQTLDLSDYDRYIINE